MHSISEIAGVEDVGLLMEVLVRLYEGEGM